MVTLYVAWSPGCVPGAMAIVPWATGSAVGVSSVSVKALRVAESPA